MADWNAHGHAEGTCPNMKDHFLPLQAVCLACQEKGKRQHLHIIIMFSFLPLFTQNVVFFVFLYLCAQLCACCYEISVFALLCSAEGLIAPEAPRSQVRV